MPLLTMLLGNSYQRFSVWIQSYNVFIVLASELQKTRRFTPIETLNKAVSVLGEKED